MLLDLQVRKKMLKWCYCHVLNLTYKCFYTNQNCGRDLEFQQANASQVVSSWTNSIVINVLIIILRWRVHAPSTWWCVWEYFLELTVSSAKEQLTISAALLRDFCRLAMYTAIKGEKNWLVMKKGRSIYLSSMQDVFLQVILRCLKVTLKKGLGDILPGEVREPYEIFLKNDRTQSMISWHILINSTYMHT